MTSSPERKRGSFPLRYMQASLKLLASIPPPHQKPQHVQHGRSSQLEAQLSVAKALAGRVCGANESCPAINDGTGGLVVMVSPKRTNQRTNAPGDTENGRK